MPSLRSATLVLSITKPCFQIRGPANLTNQPTPLTYSIYKNLPFVDRIFTALLETKAHNSQSPESLWQLQSDRLTELFPAAEAPFPRVG